MLATVSITVAVLSVVLLLASGAWTERTYRRFDRLPGHYDIRGNATRLDPRRQMAWLLPGLFSVVLLGLVAFASFIPDDPQGGNAWPGVVLVSFSFLAAQGLVLSLLARWAARQPE